MTILANMWRFAHRRGAKESQPDMIPTDDHGDSINRQPVVSSAGWVILSLIGTLWLALFSLWFLSQEEFIYSWDSSGHWHGWIRFCDRLTLNPVAILKDLFGSINHREYNDVANVLIALPGKLFGYELSVFAVSVVVGYILPFLLLLGWLSYSILAQAWRTYQLQKDPWLAALALGVMATYVWLLLFGIFGAFLNLPTMPVLGTLMGLTVVAQRLEEHKRYQEMQHSVQATLVEGRVVST